MINTLMIIMAIPTVSCTVLKVTFFNAFFPSIAPTKAAITAVAMKGKFSCSKVAEILL